MALHSGFFSVAHAHPYLTIAILPLIFIVVHVGYVLSPFHALAHVPGPLLPRLSPLVLLYHAWIGNEVSTVHEWHMKYGKIVRTGPNSVDIADGSALDDIYARKGGFLKPEFYNNFDIDGHRTIFSEIRPDHRAVRAKPVVALFAMNSLRQGQDVIHEVVNLFVSRFKSEKERVQGRKGQRVNLLHLTRGLALDTVTGYLYGRRYGGLDEVGDVESKTASAASEEEGVLSAGGMVDAFVAVGRYWYLPPWIFQWVEWFDSSYGEASKHITATTKSLDAVDDFVSKVVIDAQEALASSDSASPTKDDRPSTVNGISTTSYPARLLSAGISFSETKAQCKDLIFAGTDSTGMNLATILFYLARQPAVYHALRTEILKKKPTFDDLQSLPYLRGVIKEGLRLSMANPSRLPRVVPPTGWKFEDVFFPSGTVVSCTPFELHLNPEVFPDPREFKPERWVDTEHIEVMNRDSIPFGLGSRQCIARNLATVELYVAVSRIAEEDLLKGARCVGDRIQILEWFNSKVVNEKIGLEWE